MKPSLRFLRQFSIATTNSWATKLSYHVCCIPVPKRPVQLRQQPSSARTATSAYSHPSDRTTVHSKFSPQMTGKPVNYFVPPLTTNQINSISDSDSTVISTIAPPLFLSQLALICKNLCPNDLSHLCKLGTGTMCLNALEQDKKVRDS